MNAGGPPPPPPPPPIPGIIPSSRLPTESSGGFPVMDHPPAALASAMMKERKPFTYTPGGLDLSEISSQNPPQENGAPTDAAAHSGEFSPPIQSRSFRVLQSVLDQQDTADPQGPVHIPNIRQQQKPQYQPNYQQQPGHYQPPSYKQQPGGVNAAASTEETTPEPKKYMGGNIPSRSFRMLQAMTANDDDVSDDGDHTTVSEASSKPDGDKPHAGSQIPSPTSKGTTQNSPSSLSPSTLTGTNDTSSDSGISSSSKISPSYTTTKDSRVYRQVSPKIVINGSKNEHVVNSALSNTSSQSSNCSSPTWKTPTFSQSPLSFSSVTPQSGSKLPEDNNESDRESPRLMKIIRQESSSPQNHIVEKRYEGAHIPSRVFRHLMAEFPASGSGENSESLEVKSRTNSKSPSPRHEGGPIPVRVIRSFQNEPNTSFDSDTTDASRASSSFAELDEYYHNGIANTAATKENVLKELTSQFDHTGIRKKPKAAPGKVFRYLQAQYDDKDDVDIQQQQSSESLQPDSDQQQSFGYRGSKVPSPSFRFLQSQYHQKPEEVPVSEEPPAPDAPQHVDEPTPYSGGRLPGRTFRYLQENITTHPSVLKPRK